MANLLNAFRNDIEMHIRESSSADEVALEFCVDGFIPNVDTHYFYWMKTYWVYKFLCWLVAKKIPLVRVMFSEGSSHTPNDYTNLFDCPIQFGSERNAIVMSRSTLALPVVRTEVEYLNQEFLETQKDWFEISGTEPLFADRIEQVLLDVYRRGIRSPNLDVVADVMCCSSRTLTRRLQREGLAFQQLKDRVRRDIAQKLLTSSHMSIADIASRVGFAEPSDFTRAFVAWTRITPSRYRSDRKGVATIKDRARIADHVDVFAA